jgi:hypothetical protein
MRLEDTALEEMAWLEPEACQNCVFFSPWNGVGWGCSHKEIYELLGGICRCGGKYFKQVRPWQTDGKITV